MGTFAFADLVRSSSELRRESAQLKDQLRVSINESHAIIRRSRNLLDSGRLVGTQRLQNHEPGAAIFPELRETTSFPETQTSPVEEATNLIHVVEQNFTGETLRLDGRHFVDCQVEKCVLEYDGGPCVLEGTNFSGCRFRFGGEAAKTVAMLECFGLMEEPSGHDVAPSAPSPAGTARVN